MSASPFDAFVERYDAWFDTPAGKTLFANELAAIRLLWRPAFNPALEIGVGTGRFAQALDIGLGVDPSESALTFAESRGIMTSRAQGESLPFADRSFAGIALITALSLVSDPRAVLVEAARVLRLYGRLLIGEIPRGSPWGDQCEAKKRSGDPFYASMRLFSVGEIDELLLSSGFEPVAYSSTLISSKPGAPLPEAPRRGVNVDAGFVCVLSRLRR